MASIPTIAIFGATGGTGLAILRFLLAQTSPPQITILVRTPAKLHGLLYPNPTPSTTSSPSASTTPTAPLVFPQNLNIITGDITAPTSVRAALLTRSGRPVDVAISCVGMTPDLGSLSPFKHADAHLCENAARSIVTELAAVAAAPSTKPLFVALSTTGVSATRDVPLLVAPLYRLLGATPHGDKAKMEGFLRGLREGGPVQWVLVRPSFLGGDGRGEVSGRILRVGVENGDVVEKSEIGYSISREDVAGWIVENLLLADARAWVGKAVSLTW